MTTPSGRTRKGLVGVSEYHIKVNNTIIVLVVTYKRWYLIHGSRCPQSYGCHYICRLSATSNTRAKHKSPGAFIKSYYQYQGMIGVWEKPFLVFHRFQVNILNIGYCTLLSRSPSHGIVGIPGIRATTYLLQQFPIVPGLG